MSLSVIGKQWAQRSSIVNLMADLSDALTENPSMIFMGGGNPARIASVENLFCDQFKKLSKDCETMNEIFGVYQSPQGNLSFRKVLAKYLADTQGWTIDEKNIAVVSGSQTAFYLLFNMYAGEFEDGSRKTIHLPLSPEYVGYKDIGINRNLFSASRPILKRFGQHEFKYYIDFGSFSETQGIGAIAVSRPNNPTGNVITDDELMLLDKAAKQRNVPLIIDGAYGLPFPNMINVEANTHWNENTILVLSLSKIGLPGVRCGIVVAQEDIVQTVSNAATALNLASGNLGPAILAPLIHSNLLTDLTENQINEFYRDKATLALELFHKRLKGLPYCIHRAEGAMFLWIWFEGLPISSQELYQRLKKRGVMVVPGEDFFLGISSEWQHTRECIRVSYAQDNEVIEAGVDIIADEVRHIYAM